MVAILDAGPILWVSIVLWFS